MKFRHFFKQILRQNLLLIFVLALSVLLRGIMPAGAEEGKALPHVIDLRIGQHEQTTRLVIELSQVVPAQVFYLPDPYRLVIDLPAIDWDVSPSLGLKESGVISGFRYGLFQASTSRVVLDLTKPAVVKRQFTLPPSSLDKGGMRMVFDLEVVADSAFQEKARASLAAYQLKEQAAAAAEEKPVVTAPTPKPSPAQDIIPEKPLIVIDAGHGGVDPGAIGRNGTYEKEITLAMAKSLRDTLQKTGRYRVMLTRDRDIFLKLRDRMNVARKNNADLFISLHADSHNSGKARGLSVYTLSENASDKEAARLASKENKADLIAGIDLSSEADDVSSILLDLAQRETMNMSAHFAQVMVKEMGKVTSLLRNTHRFAGFVVLKAPDIPSILVELGYLSNSTDEKNLKSSSHRAKMAASMVTAIDNYFHWRRQLVEN